MWFKNILIYNFPADRKITADALQEKLAAKPLLPCSGLTRQSRGWIPCAGDGRLVHSFNNQLLFALGTEQKLLPASVINRFASERIENIEAQQGYKVGRRERKEIREAITEELLPKAFSLQRTTHAWLDMENGRLIIHAASSARAEELLEFLNKTLEDMPARLLHTALSPMSGMTDWLAGQQPPPGFTIDRELELREAGDSRASVRYANHALEGEEILAHIRSGKRATRLGLTWNSRISFVLTEQMQIKKLQLLDIHKEESEAESAEAQFELDFALMTGEFAKMLNDLTEALGGEIISS